MTALDSWLGLSRNEQRGGPNKGLIDGNPNHPQETAIMAMHDTGPKSIFNAIVAQVEARKAACVAGKEAEYLAAVDARAMAQIRELRRILRS